MSKSDKEKLAEEMAAKVGANLPPEALDALAMLGNSKPDYKPAEIPGWLADCIVPAATPPAPAGAEALTVVEVEYEDDLKLVIQFDKPSSALLSGRLTKGQTIALAAIDAALRGPQEA
jgi:hypothetical protein